MNFQKVPCIVFVHFPYFIQRLQSHHLRIFSNAVKNGMIWMTTKASSNLIFNKTQNKSPHAAAIGSG